MNLPEVLIAKSMLSEQLQSLTHKFNYLISDDSYDHEEANVKPGDTAANLKHVPLVKNIDELVC